jgi:hypothetical protein
MRKRRCAPMNPGEEEIFAVWAPRRLTAGMFEALRENRLEQLPIKLSHRHCEPSEAI